MRQTPSIVPLLHRVEAGILFLTFTGPLRKQTQLGLACSPEPPLHRHALVPIDFRHRVRRLTQKHLSRLLLPAAGIRPAVFHGARFPAPGSCRRSDATGIRGLGGPSSSDPWAQAVGDMPGPALCPGHALTFTLPSTDRLPSTLSAPDLSAGVVRGFAGTMQPSESSDLPVRLWLLAFPNRPGTALAAAGGRRSPRFRHDP